METQLNTSTLVTVKGDNPAAGFSFDLRRIRLNEKQRAIVYKLFSQNPEAAIAEGNHSHAAERGKDGPAAKYLSKEEFAAVRELGVRLGTSGVVAMTVCDFCLHCVKLESIPDLGIPAD